jgi:hypothetical protein
MPVLRSSAPLGASAAMNALRLWLAATWWFDLRSGLALAIPALVFALTKVSAILWIESR